MKIGNLILVLAKLDPELEVYFDTENDLDPIEKITAFQEMVVLNFRR